MKVETMGMASTSTSTTSTLPSLAFTCLLTILLAGLEAKTQNIETAVDTQTVSQTTTAFSPDEMYRDILPLTSRNFTKKVLKSKETWIIIFHNGMLTRSWKRMAVAMRGQVWHGMIDRSKEKRLIERLVSLC